MNARKYAHLHVAFALLFGGGLLLHLDHGGRGDWDYHTAWALAARRTVLDFHQWPAWNPWHCGGMVSAANLQSRAWSPSLLLVLPFGEVLGNRLWALLMLAAGFLGTRRLACELGAGRWGALFAALLFAGHGGVFLHLAHGHLIGLPFLLIPAWMLGVRRSWSEPAGGALAAGAVAALCWLEGAIYALVYGGALISLWTAAEAARRRSLRPILGLLGCAAASLLLAMPTLPSVFAHAAENLRRQVAPESIPLAALPAIFLGAQQPIHGPPPFSGLPWGWHEYGAYVGLPATALGLLGLPSAPAAARRWLLPAGLFFLLALGDFSAFSPWTLLHALPVGENLRASGRAFVPALLCLLLAAAPGLDPALSQASARLSRTAPALGGALPPLSLALVALDLGRVGPPALWRAFPVEAPARPAAAASGMPAFRQTWDLRHQESMLRHAYTTMTADIQENRGILRCYETARPPLAAVDRAGAGEEWLLPDAASPVLRRFWSPLRLELDFEPRSQPSVLVVNQNAHRAFRGCDGRPSGSAGGALALPIEAAEGSACLAYVPTRELSGVLVAAATLLVLRRLARGRSAKDEQSAGD